MKSYKQLNTSFFAIILLLFFYITIVSCFKNKEIITRSVKEVSLRKNELFTLDLGAPCPECGLSISKQASHYVISNIIFDTSRQSDIYFIYNYKPALNFTGSDEVEIKSSSGSDGSSPNNIHHYELLKFTITN